MAKEIRMQKPPYITKDELLKILKKNGVIIDELLNKALLQAEKTHKNAKRDDGGPYLEKHIYPVAVDIINYFKSEKPGMKIPQETIISALLHDVLEDDHDISEEEFKKMFGKKIFDIVLPLTKPWHRQNISQEEMFEINKVFFNNIIRSNESSILIKLADRTSNTEGFLGFSNLDFPKYHRSIKEVELEYLPYAKKHNKYFFKRLSDVMDELKKRSKE